MGKALQPSDELDKSSSVICDLWATLLCARGSCTKCLGITDGTSLPLPIA